MEDGVEFPPVTCYADGSTTYLIDGWLTYLAAKQLGRRAIEAHVRTGSRREMRLFAASSNAGHGLQRTLADRRLAVLITLEESPTWTVPQVAAHCRVSAFLVVGLVEVRARMPDLANEDVAAKGSRE